MRLEIKDKEVIIWQTGGKINNIRYQSSEELNKYRRSDLSNFEAFLREQGETVEADKIKNYLGKIIRRVEIPQIIPTGSYRVGIPLTYLKNKIKDFQEQYGLDLDPDFQRGHVWNTEQRIRYVEFILQGGKTEPIYFNHTEWMKSFDGDFVIVDGKQRLTSLLMFLDNEFTVFKNLDKDGIGFYCSEFNDVFISIEYAVNDLPTREQVLQWYLQMNTGNIQHSDEEIERVRRLLEKEKRYEKEG